MALHLCALWIALLPRDGAVLAKSAPGQGASTLRVFDVAATTAQVRERRRGTADGTDARSAIPSAGTEAIQARGSVDAVGKVDRSGADEALARAAAEALGDDAGAAGDRIDYRRRLLDHIRPFRAYPKLAVKARQAGAVVVRFRIGRNGEVVDLRVLKTSGALLDAAAMNTIWRAEPMPPVPPTLTTPWEVDVPIDFVPPAQAVG